MQEVSLITVKGERSMSGILAALLKFTICLLAILLTSHSFSAPTITTERPGGELTPLDESIPKTESGQPSFILPDVHSPAVDGQLSEQIKVFVRHIELIGNTVFSDQELEKITASYEGREITTDELQALRIKLTQYYLEHGYINSGAIIPDQKVNSEHGFS
jgi:hemolysin activation/secretion protein